METAASMQMTARRESSYRGERSVCVRLREGIRRTTALLFEKARKVNQSLQRHCRLTRGKTDVEKARLKGSLYSPRLSRIALYALMTKRPLIFTLLLFFYTAVGAGVIETAKTDAEKVMNAGAPVCGTNASKTRGVLPFRRSHDAFRRNRECCRLRRTRTASLPRSYQLTQGRISCRSKRKQI